MHELGLFSVDVIKTNGKNKMCAGSILNCAVNSVEIVEKQACTQVAL
jgi:hypothetical protein